MQAGKINCLAANCPLNWTAFAIEYAGNVMPTLLHITYYERAVDASGVHVDKIIGQEAFDDIREALVPTKTAHPVYITKHFSHDSNTRWHVEESDRIGSNGDVPMTYRVILSKVHNQKETYLDEALRLSSHKIHQVLTPGTLVEVDYGFVQTVAQARGTMASNSQYKDTIQNGEMHKRRLAIVVKVRNTQVQVVPLTSVPPDPQDKTAFLLNPLTLSKFSFYGTSGKQTWGICSMIQTVSPCRLLPPSSFYTDNKGIVRHARPPKYSDHVSTAEMDAMRSALLHAIGVSNYDKLKQDAQNWRGAATALSTLQEQVILLQQENATLKQNASRQACVEELAVDWAKQCGLNFEDQVAGLMEINAALEQGA